MDSKKIPSKSPRYQSESWRTDDPESAMDVGLTQEEQRFAGFSSNPQRKSKTQPDIRDQTRVLDLLGRINYRIIKGGRVYIETDGVVYRTLYGGYWRSVFTGAEHYLFRCEQVSGAVWAEEESAETAVDLPIVFSNDGWSANGHSLLFILSGEWEGLKRRTARWKKYWPTARARVRKTLTPQ
jgi:hypothetical protein